MYINSNLCRYVQKIDMCYEQHQYLNKFLENVILQKKLFLSICYKMSSALKNTFHK